MTRYAKLASFLLPMVAIAVGVAWVWCSHVPPEERFRNALVALQQGDDETVRAEIEHLRGNSRFANHVRLLNGGLSLKAGRYEEALTQLDSVALSGELRVPAMLISGESLYRLGRLAEAERTMRRLASERPDHPEPHRLLAAIYYDQGAMDQAIEELKIVARLVPGDFRPHRLMALIHRDFEQFQQATVDYRQALSLHPPAAIAREIVRGLAESLVRLRKYEPALKVLDATVDDAHLLALKAECHWSLGQTSEARRLVDLAQRLNPDERSALLLRGRMRLDAGDAQGAIAPLKRAVAGDPHDYKCRYQLALAYRRLGRTKSYEAEIARMTRSQNLYKRLSELNKEAIRRPRDAEVRDKLAEVCRKLGKQEMSRMWSNAAEVCRRAK
jgi:Flp pilus assembly protein TadD